MPPIVCLLTDITAPIHSEIVRGWHVWMNHLGEKSKPGVILFTLKAARLSHRRSVQEVPAQLPFCRCQPGVHPQKVRPPRLPLRWRLLGPSPDLQSKGQNPFRLCPARVCMDFAESIRAITAAAGPRTPLSDAEIAQRLAEEGLTVAGRTVSKHRRNAGLPGGCKNEQKNVFSRSARSCPSKN